MFGMRANGCAPEGKRTCALKAYACARLRVDDDRALSAAKSARDHDRRPSTDCCGAHQHAVAGIPLLAHMRDAIIRPCSTTAAQVVAPAVRSLTLNTSAAIAVCAPPS